MRILPSLMMSLKKISNPIHKRCLLFPAFEAGFAMKKLYVAITQERLIMLSLVSLLVMFLVGCESFAIQGRVVQGPIGSMRFVSNNMAGQNGAAIAGAVITIYRDPDSLAMKVAGTAISDNQGRFVLKLDAFGAGWMLEQWKFVVQQQGFTNVIWRQSLETDNAQQLLLVTMTGGYSEPISRDDLWKQYEKLHQPRDSKINK